MRRRDLKKLADGFLVVATERLMELPYKTLQAWPEWPNSPKIDLSVPESLAKYHFGVMKDTQADGSIRIAIQRYRSHLFGVGEMAADGFFVSPNGEVRRFVESDLWEVT